MEVVIALAIFAGAAAVVHLGLSRSLLSAGRLRLQTRAENLALSKLAEIRAGLDEAATSGPNAYEDERLEGWQWSVEVTDVSDTSQAPPMQRVVVTVDYPQADVRYRAVDLRAREGDER
jgi:type II secretory pathway pseudopilin PulG